MLGQSRRLPLWAWTGLRSTTAVMTGLRWVPERRLGASTGSTNSSTSRSRLSAVPRTRRR